MELFVDKCDLVFRKIMRKRINVWVYDEYLENIGVVYKIGVIINLIKGYIFSLEYYDKFKDENNRDYIFFVQGIGNCFFKDGDSGFFVFFRFRKNYVDVFGMVFGSNLEVYDEDSEDENVGYNFEFGGSKSLEMEEMELSFIKQDDKLIIYMFVFKVMDDDFEGILFCYCIIIVLEFFKRS